MTDIDPFRAFARALAGKSYDEPPAITKTLLLEMINHLNADFQKLEARLRALEEGEGI